MHYLAYIFFYFLLIILSQRLYIIMYHIWLNQHYFYPLFVLNVQYTLIKVHMNKYVPPLKNGKLNYIFFILLLKGLSQNI